MALLRETEKNKSFSQKPWNLTKNPKNIKKDKFLMLLAQAFQRRFRQDLINGKIDNECLLISENLVKKPN